MTSDFRSPVNKLDIIRRTQGIDYCKNTFNNLAKESKQNAVNLINDKNLFFTSLFVLHPEINELDIMNDLNERNQIALKICDIINCEMDSDYACDISLKSDNVHHVLLWIFNTGTVDDGLNDEFEEVLDSTASVLVKEHHEKKIIPAMTDMIFKRNRDDKYIHDLVWACFQIKDVNCLRYFAERLRSSNSKDVELARTLLNIPQDTPLSSNFEKQKQYNSYQYWLRDNTPYMYFTGESFNLTNSPNPFNIDLDAKYLCKNGYVNTSKSINHVTDSEKNYLTDFSKLPKEEKDILAKKSQYLHAYNPSYWSKWIHYPIDKQIESAHGRRDSI